MAIDINDTFRDWTNQFALYYKANIDRSFDVDNLTYRDDSVFGAFPFPTIESRNTFMYRDYPYELFGCNPLAERTLHTAFNIWHNRLQEYEGETPHISVVAPNEYDLAIQSTFYFLSKTGCRVREVTFPVTSLEIWDKNDIVLTANPVIFKTKPEGKILIRIKKDYNSSPCEDIVDFSYDKLSDFLNDEETQMKIFKLTGANINKDQTEETDEHLQHE